MVACFTSCGEEEMTFPVSIRWSMTNVINKVTKVVKEVNGVLAASCLHMVGLSNDDAREAIGYKHPDVGYLAVNCVGSV